MDRLTQEDLRDLLDQQHAQPCVSIFMPTQRMSAEIQQNPLRFKNLMRRAEELLAEFGFRGPEAGDLLDKAQREFRFDEIFWQHQADALAVFISPELFRYYRLPLNVDELVHVGERFYVRPLFDLFQNQGSYYVLMLTREGVRLLEGDQHGLAEVSPEAMPAALSGQLRREFAEEQDQTQQVSKPRTGNRGAIDATFHGHGVGNDDEKAQVYQYFQRVDAGLRAFLTGRQVPVVLAGVEYLHPMYHQANEYPHVLDQGIQGSVDDMRLDELHSLAWEIVAPIFQREKQEAAGLFQRLAGKDTGRASTDLQEIVQAAYGGRVGQLFLRPGAPIWGSYDLAENRIAVHPQRLAESEDLLNTAAVFTFANGGVVYTTQDGELPEGVPFAAVFRY